MHSPAVLNRTTDPLDSDPAGAAPIPTHKGAAVRAAYRLSRALRALDDEARAEVLGVLYLGLADPATA